MSENTKTPREITEEVVRLLYEAGAHNWAIQDKGVLLAAVKLALQKQRGEIGG